MRAQSDRDRLARELQLARAGHTLRFELLGVGCAAPRILRAEAELALLHRRELARLLGEAALLRLGGACAATVSLAAWRCAFEDELESARADGASFSSALHSLIERCGRDDADGWPAAAGLALAGLALHDSARARRRLAEAWIAEGEVGLALALALEPAGRSRGSAGDGWLGVVECLDPDPPAAPSRDSA